MSSKDSSGFLESSSNLQICSEEDLICYEGFPWSGEPASTEAPNSPFKLSRVNSFDLSSPLDSHPELSGGDCARPFDHLMKVSAEVKFSRHTLHLAVRYILLFLARTSGYSSQDLKVIGIAALLLAMKVNEFRSKHLLWPKNGSPSVQSVVEMESLILDALNWDTLQTTSSQCLVQLMQKWDSASLQYFSGQFPSDCERKLLENGYILFTNHSGDAYKYFQDAFQRLDTVILDVGSASLPQEELAAAILYQVINEHSSKSDFRFVRQFCLTDFELYLRELFCRFTGISASSLIEQLKYIRRFGRLTVLGDITTASFGKIVLFI